MTRTLRRPGALVTVGETMGLLRAVEIGSLRDVSELRLGTGGAESNVSIGAARLGVPAVWLGRVGDDAIGDRVVRDIRGAGVQCLAVRDPDAATGVMVKHSPTADTSSVLYYRAGSAGSRLHPDDLGSLDWSAAGLLHLTGITTALSPSARETVRTAIGAAEAHGVPISFDVNHRQRLWTTGEFADVYREIASRATIVFAGEDEAALLVDTGDTDEAGAGARALADGVAQLGPETVVIKRGADGAAALDGGVWWTQPAVPIRPVDTVGAGDAFVAGWIAEWFAGSPPAQRLATATQTGAHACLNPGDWEGSPTWHQLGEMRDRRDPVSR